MQKRLESKQELLGEMMLAKTVLEEKNEIIAQKDQAIRVLHSREIQLRSELETMKQELERHEIEQNRVAEAAFCAGRRQVLEDVIRLIDDYGSCALVTAQNMAARLLALFQEKYQLEIIDQPPRLIDPENHRVIEVEEENVPDTTIHVLANGYRLAGRVIKPMLVRVGRKPLPAANGGSLGALPEGSPENEPEGCNRHAE